MSVVTLNGSCLCGSIKYQVTGEALRFYHCHCQRCRKLTGTGHASNLVITPENALSWLQGENLISEYKLPEAERFYNRFCRQCGSPVPRNVPELGAVIIPAGSLDCEPPVQPQARIFWNSRANWSCSANKTSDALPVFEEYMP